MATTTTSSELNNNEAHQGNAEPQRMNREYLSLKPIRLAELPPHSEFTPDATPQSNNLVSFLSHVLTEALQVDFENGWTSHGTWRRQGTSTDIDVNAEQRLKGKGKNSWLARRSHHNVLDVEYLELDELLSQDHARKEAEYTPSVYDANELLKWKSQELEQAVAQLNPEWRVKSVQMSVYQMFHTMPSALSGLFKLQDRVFHVLVVTAQSEYRVETEGETKYHPQSHTLQLPIDMASLKAVPSVVKNSHTDEDTKHYKSASPSSTQQNHLGNSLTEGCYVSLERLQKAPHEASVDCKGMSCMHRWDMMTMSDAKGITRIASSNAIIKGTLDAVTKDVYYVLDHIKSRKGDEQGQGDSKGHGDIKLTRVQT